MYKVLASQNGLQILPFGDKEIIKMYNQIGEILKQVEGGGGILMARRDTQGKGTAFESVRDAKSGPLSFQVVSRLKCVVGNIEHSVPVSFETDMITITKDGEIMIWDFKTWTAKGEDKNMKTAAKDKYEGYCRQLQYYKSLLESDTGISVAGLNLITINKNGYEVNVVDVPNINETVNYTEVDNALTQKIAGLEKEISVKEEQIARERNESKKKVIQRQKDNLEEEKRNMKPNRRYYKQNSRR